MNKISLCLIVGNVEEYIERCLTSFAPIADEICVVRAIGNATPDKTLDIARDKFGARVSEYINAKGHEDWPHVDSFSAARQQSFDMATGEYCFWCDSDDILSSGVELIRQHAQEGKHDAFIFPYKIFGKGLDVPRERMIRKSLGRWQFAVHECFNFYNPPVNAIEDQRVVITHLPHTSKTGSNDRNLRILRSIPESEMTTGLYYHLHLELALQGDVEGSVEAAKQVLSRSDLGRPEKYELFLNLANVAKTPTEKHILLHQAYMTDPRRREALGLLINNALNYNQDEEGMAYARQMMATEHPKFADWNNRSGVYGWVGEDLYMQALRANGKYGEAESLRLQRLRSRGGPRIALLHATRGRPEQASAARFAWLQLASQPERIEHIYIFDNDDTRSTCLRRFHHQEIKPGGGCVAAWNAGFNATSAPIVIQLSDDWTPIPQWDDLVCERIGNPALKRVLAVSDGNRKDDLMCMAIATRAYLNQDGWIFHPRFKSMYSDNYFSWLAYRRGAVIEARDLVFTHNHPAFGTAENDATYEQQNAPERYAEGKKIYEELTGTLDV